MILPSKILPKEKSLIYKAILLLDKYEGNIPLTELYRKNNDIFDGFHDFIRVLTVLYALGYIEINEGVVFRI